MKLSKWYAPHSMAAVQLMSSFLKNFTNSEYLQTTSHSTNGLNFQINTESNALANVEGLTGVNVGLNFTASTSTFSFNFFDSTNAVDQACLEIRRISGGTNEIVNSSCSTSESGTIVLAVANNTQSSYLATGVLQKTDQGVSYTLIA